MNSIIILVLVTHLMIQEITFQKQKVTKNHQNFTKKVLKLDKKFKLMMIIILSNTSQLYPIEAKVRYILNWEIIKNR